MDPHRLGARQPKHKIRRKAPGVPLDRLVQRSRLYSINLREVAGKDHALPSHQHGQPFDDGYNLAGRRHEILLPPTDTRAIDVRSHAMSLRRAGQ